MQTPRRLSAESLDGPWTNVRFPRPNRSSPRTPIEFDPWALRIAEMHLDRPGNSRACFRHVSRQRSCVMSRLSARQILNLVLAVLVAAGLSVSVAWAANPPAKAAVMAMDMSPAAPGDCQHCPADRDGVKGMVFCDGMCPAPILAVAPQIAAAEPIKGQALSAPRQSPLHGRTPPPEPYPPKPSRIV